MKHQQAPGIRIQANVVFGDSSAGCTGRGICRLMITQNWPGPFPAYRVWVRRHKEHLTLSWIKKDLPENVRQFQFDSKRLFIPAAPHLDYRLRRALGTEAEQSIASGFYVVLESEKTLTVKVRLQKDKILHSDFVAARAHRPG